LLCLKNLVSNNAIGKRRTVLNDHLKTVPSPDKNVSERDFSTICTGHLFQYCGAFPSEMHRNYRVVWQNTKSNTRWITCR
jgi:hypothetical protein